MFGYLFFFSDLRVKRKIGFFLSFRMIISSCIQPRKPNCCGNFSPRTNFAPQFCKGTRKISGQIKQLTKSKINKEVGEEAVLRKNPKQANQSSVQQNKADIDIQNKIS